MTAAATKTLREALESARVRETFAAMRAVKEAVTECEDDDAELARRVRLIVAQDAHGWIAQAYRERGLDPESLGPVPA